MSLQRGINLKALAEKMGQCSGAEVRGICTEAGKRHACACSDWDMADALTQGMYALRERRQHVTQEDFEFAVAKVRSDTSASRIGPHSPHVGIEEATGGEHVCEQTFLMIFLCLRSARSSSCLTYLVLILLRGRNDYLCVL
jgi:hypothetical protein